jgi:hypothetical protein
MIGQSERRWISKGSTAKPPLDLRCVLRRVSSELRSGEPADGRAGIGVVSNAYTRASRAL